MGGSTATTITTEQHKEVKPIKNDRTDNNNPSKNKTQILISDFFLSLMWVCSGPFIKILVHHFLGFPHNLTAEIVTFGLKIVNMFIFAMLMSATNGGSYNPLTVLAAALSGGSELFLFTLGARIPTQVFGSIAGVKLLIATVPGIGRGPKLNVEIHHGALTEGVLSFMIASLSIGLKRNLPGSFYMKNWISSVAKITLNILGSDLTGGCMNPASVMGWAFVRGDHITQEHIVVYWLAPVVATFIAVWTSRVVFPTAKDKKTKSE